MSILLDVKLKKATKAYFEGETIYGVVVVSSPSDIRHDGITLVAEGIVNVQLSSKTFGIFEALYNSAKPVTLVSYTLDIAPSGKMPSGTTEIPFEIPLVPKGSKQLYETYYGVYVSIQYTLKCEMKRSFLAKDLYKVTKFIVEQRESNCNKANIKPAKFLISPDSLQNVKERSRIPRFKISGKLDSTECCISKAFTGEITVHHCEVPIKSIEVQLVRVETCGCAEGYSRDATEVQNIQIGDGDVTPGLAIPIHMIFPRLFTCPTLVTPSFKIEFEVNIVVIFHDDHLITENFPITITRA